ncbi:MAG: glycoside hydrolase family protein [Planctomycetota bacterium]
MPAQPPPAGQLPTGQRLLPVPRHAQFSDPDFYIWGASMTRTPDGTCHLLYARWPRSAGHDAWVTESEIAHATADDPLGPYTHQSVVLPARGNDHWDARCTHNPTVCHFNDQYFLYYMGTFGDDLPDPRDKYWDHRNHQRIGVAVADHPAGPWQRFDQPLINCTPGTHAGMCCANPSVTQRPDGSFLMIYKAVGDQNPPPKFGPVVHLAALADSPTGPFMTLPDPIFTAENSDFPAEDPFIWVQDGTYHAIVKDMNGSFTPHGMALVAFTSPDGLNWSPADEPFLTTPQITWTDGQTQTLGHLERPQLYLEDGQPKVLFCAADDTHPDRPHSFNLHIPLG